MIAKGTPNDIREFLKKELPDVEVALKYFNITSYPANIHSPIRKDERPSFSLFLLQDRTVMFKDFATGESGNIYQLLSHTWGISLADTYKKVYKEFLEGRKSDTIKGSSSVVLSDIHERSRYSLKIKIRKWEKFDLEYWESFGISLSSLRMAEVYPISHTIYVSETGGSSAFKCDKYAYAYVERRGCEIFLKVYQPFSKTNKWRSSTDSSIWNLETKIPETGETLFLTSSLKDALNLWENTGIPSVCMQGEGYLPDEKKMEEFKRRFKNVIVFFDNDYGKEGNPGKTFAEKISEKFHVPHVLIPEKYGSKDPSDLYRNVGKERYLEIVSSLICRLIEWDI